MQLSRQTFPSRSPPSLRLCRLSGPNAVLRKVIFGLRGQSGLHRTASFRFSRPWTCRARRGSSHFVLDRTKRQAPVWRESYRKQDGAKRARWWVDGKPGRQPDYRLNPNRSSYCLRERIKACYVEADLIAVDDSFGDLKLNLFLACCFCENKHAILTCP